MIKKIEKKTLVWINIELPIGAKNQILRNLRTWMWDNGIHAVPLTSGSGGPHNLYGVYELAAADRIEAWLNVNDDPEVELTFTRT